MMTFDGAPPPAVRKGSAFPAYRPHLLLIGAVAKAFQKRRTSVRDHASILSSKREVLKNARLILAARRISYVA